MPATSRRKTPARELKRELKKDRLELRVAASAKALIQRAMAVSGLTAGDLAYEGARRVLDEHERMVLTGANRDAFLDAVLNPPEPTEKRTARKPINSNLLRILTDAMPHQKDSARIIVRKMRDADRY